MRANSWNPNHTIFNYGEKTLDFIWDCILHPLSSRSENKDDHTGLWLALTFSTSLQPLNKIQRNLTRSKISTYALYQVRVCWADRSTKMASPASDWLRHFQLLCNCWTEFNEIWQETRSQHLLPSLRFFLGPIGKTRQPLRPLTETFSTSRQLLNGTQRNMTGSNISTSSTKFVFSGRSENQDDSHGLWLNFSATSERNSTNMDRKQDLNVLSQY